jgi:acyl carrier protein
MKTTKGDLIAFLIQLLEVNYDIIEPMIYSSQKLDDLGIDSLDKVEISCEIEKKFKVSLDDDAIDNTATWGEFVEVAFSAFETDNPQQTTAQ